MKVERDTVEPRKRMKAGLQATSSTALACLLAILAFCTIVASIWLVRVPFYQEPDEIAHVDYIFTLFDVGHPFRARNTHPAGEVAPQTRYVERAIDYRAMRYNPYARAPKGYGTAAFFDRLDSAAPAPSGRSPRAGAALPYFMYLYPPGYYVIEAAVLTATYRLAGSLSDGFFAMRALNVVLLIGTLVLSYFSMRAYGLTERVSLLAVLGIGAFPLVSRVSSYVQPDNATTFLIALVIFAVARSRHERSWRFDLLATVGLSLLFLVKPPYAFAAWLATAPLLRFRGGGRRASPALRIGMLVLPLIVYVVSNRFLNPVSGFESPAAWVHRTSGTMPPSAGASDFFRLVIDAVGECLNGSVFYGFWFAFGFRGGRFFSDRALGPIFQVLTVVLVVSFFMAERMIWRRILVVARARGWHMILRLAVADHCVTLYIVTSAMLVLAHVLSGGALELEGRYWCAMLLPLVIVILRTLVRPLPVSARRTVTIALASAMAAYSLITSTVASRAMHEDFYGHRTPKREPLADIIELKSAGGVSSTSHLLTLRSPQPILVSGFAIDMLTGFAAKQLYVEVDGRERIEASSVELPYPRVAQIFNDEQVAATRFRIDVPAKSLRKGRHRLRFYVGHIRGTDGIPFPQDAIVVVT